MIAPSALPAEIARKGGVLRRPAFRIVAIVIAIGGAILVSQGLWIHAKAVLAQALLRQAFSRTIETGETVKPWPWADTWPVARIVVSRLDQSAIVLEGASGEALAFGPGHVGNTSDPGEEGTVVYAAHRDTQFAFLGDLRSGDAIDVTRSDGRHYVYRVDGTSIVRWDASGIDANASGRSLVLSTCWPFDALTHGPMRYLVHATMEAVPAAGAQRASSLPEHRRQVVLDEPGRPEPSIPT